MARAPQSASGNGAPSVGEVRALTRGGFGVHHEAPHDVVCATEDGPIWCVDDADEEALASCFVGHLQVDVEEAFHRGGVRLLRAEHGLNMKRLEHRPTRTRPDEGRRNVQICIRTKLSLAFTDFRPVEFNHEG